MSRLTTRLRGLATGAITAIQGVFATLGRPIVNPGDVWEDVEKFVVDNGLTSKPFDHAAIASAIAASILADPTHGVTAMLSHLAAQEASILVTAATTRVLTYLADWGEAGPHVDDVVIPVVGKIGPKPDGPGKAA